MHTTALVVEPMLKRVSRSTGDPSDTFFTPYTSLKTTFPSCTTTVANPGMCQSSIPFLIMASSCCAGSWDQQAGGKAAATSRKKAMIFCFMDNRSLE